jgi:hypothetical protein
VTTQLSTPDATELGVGAGYLALLDAAHDRVVPGGLVANPAGIAIASARRLPDAPPTRFGLAVVRDLAPAEPDTLAAFGAELLAAHRTLLRGTIDYAIARLDGRTSAGTTLLNRQLVQGSLAEVALAVRDEETRAELEGVANAAARRYRFQALRTANRELLRLLGARGFLTDSPGADLHLTEVAGSVYLEVTA